MKRTLFVNLYGAPGSGKSTGASYIFSNMKMSGVDCEYVQEFAKDMVWEENKFMFQDPDHQLIIFANQFHRMSRLNGKVDLVVTDSPLPLSVIYSKNALYLGEDFRTMVLRLNEKFRSLNFLLERTKPYNPNGRNQTEKESDEIQKELEKNLEDWDKNFIRTSGDRTGYNLIISYIQRAIFSLKNGQTISSAYPIPSFKGRS